MNEQKNTCKKILTILYLFVISVGFVLLFSYSTSPLYPFFYGNDPAHFMTVGKAWANGRIPYRDIFDHKGPIIYFIDMIGFTLVNNGKNGIFIIQIFLMFLTSCAAFKIINDFTNSNFTSILGSLVFLFVIKINYTTGNTVEEICLPFLGWSTYGLLRYFKKKDIEHPIWWAFFYGITTGVCLYTRATNIMPICGFIIVISIKLIYNRKVRNLIKNALMFIAGVIVVLLPFIIYFFVNGALGDMLYDVFIYNVEYMKKSSSWVVNAGKDTLDNLLRYYLLYFILIGLIAVYHILKEKTLFYGSLITFGIETYVFFRGYLWGQYPLVCAFHAIMLFAGLFELKNKEREKKGLVTSILLGLLIIITIRIPQYVYDIQVAKKEYGVRTERAWDKLVDRIPKEDLDSLIVYGNNQLKEFYLLNDIIPMYKYYIIQDWVAGFSETIKEDLIGIYKQGTAKWILVENDYNDLLKNIIRERYYEIESSDEYSLYRLK